jgi:hypothetical protein
MVSEAEVHSGRWMAREAPPGDVGWEVMDENGCGFVVRTKGELAALATLVRDLEAAFDGE